MPVVKRAGVLSARQAVGTAPCYRSVRQALPGEDEDALYPAMARVRLAEIMVVVVADTVAGAMPVGQSLS